MNAYPLTWPFGWTRAQRVRRSEFGAHTITACVEEIRRQLKLLNAKNVVISANLRVRQDGLPYSNQSQPDDRGVAVYFDLPNELNRVLACDRWSFVEHNMWAIAKHIEALRGQERWGVGTINQAFTGYAALPEPKSEEDWWIVLGIPPTANELAIRDAYRYCVKHTHPDVGGDADSFARIQRAYESALAAKNGGK